MGLDNGNGFCGGNAESSIFFTVLDRMDGCNANAVWLSVHTWKKLVQCRPAIGPQGSYCCGVPLTTSLVFSFFL